MTLALNNLQRVDILLNKETKPNQSAISWQIWFCHNDIYHAFTILDLKLFFTNSWNVRNLGRIKNYDKSEILPKINPAVLWEVLWHEMLLLDEFVFFCFFLVGVAFCLFCFCCFILFVWFWSRVAVGESNVFLLVFFFLVGRGP